MTGFAAIDGAADRHAWTWEIRGVNARGLDMRLRLPDSAQSMEPELRTRAANHVRRGAVYIALKLRPLPGDAVSAINMDALDAAVSAVNAARKALEAQGLEVAPVDPASLLSLPGISSDDDGTGLPKEVLAGFDASLKAFSEMRASEGAALAEVIAKQIDAVADLLKRAIDRLAERNRDVAERYRDQVTQLVEAAGQAVNAERLSHDLAALTVKGDVSEEIDRLTAHVAAARALMAKSGPIGRKLDFLTQEFNREANTLCSKSADTELTRIGLDLKVVIDQMREQVQNLE